MGDPDRTKPFVTLSGFGLWITDCKSPKVRESGPPEGGKSVGYRPDVSVPTRTPDSTVQDSRETT